MPALGPITRGILIAWVALWVASFLVNLANPALLSPLTLDPRALLDGQTHYCASAGLPELREVAARRIVQNCGHVFGNRQFQGSPAGAGSFSFGAAQNFGRYRGCPARDPAPGKLGITQQLGERPAGAAAGEFQKPKATEFADAVVHAIAPQPAPQGIDDAAYLAAVAHVNEIDHDRA